jgi:O-antigen ligase
MSTQPITLYRPVVLETSDYVGTVLDQLAFAFLWLMVFVIPVSEAGYEMTRWFGLAAFGLTLLRTGVLGRGRRLCELHYWMMAFALWSSLSILWTIDRDSSAMRIGTYLQLLVLAWVIWVLASSESRVLSLLQAYAFGTVICSVATISNLLAGRTMTLGDDLDGPASDRYTMNNLNPNDLGFMLALSIPMVLFLLARRKGGLVGAVACWVQMVLSMTAILLSGSRGAALTAFAALLMLPLVLGKLPGWQRVMASVASGAVVAAGVYMLPSYTWDRFLDLGNQLTEGTMTHRRQIWAASEAVFRNHPLLGVGSGAHPVAVESILGRPLVAHNTFISVLAELGVPGELLLLGLLGAAFYCAYHMAGLERIFWTVTLLAWCVGVCGGTWEYRKLTWFLFGLLAAHVYARRRATRTT